MILGCNDPVSGNPQAFLHANLEIPAAAQEKLLPCLALSVLKFLSFPFPIVSQASGTHPTSAYFSAETPTLLDTSTIQKIPIPCAETVGQLRRECSTPRIHGAKLVLNF